MGYLTLRSRNNVAKFPIVNYVEHNILLIQLLSTGNRGSIPRKRRLFLFSYSGQTANDTHSISYP